MPTFTQFLRSRIPKTVNSEETSKAYRSSLTSIWYSEVYSNVFYGAGGSGFGSRYFHKKLRRVMDAKKVKFGKIIEVGAGHLEFLSSNLDLEFGEYTAVDKTDYQTSNKEQFDCLFSNFDNNIKFVNAPAENLPFPSNSFDLGFSTCLLHHVDDPIAVMLELHRVVRVGGRIIWAMPTDPGILNRLTKTLLTYPQIKKYTDYDPKIFYAVEHRNHVMALSTILQFLHRDDLLQFKYLPLRLKSWNFNLMVIASIVKRTDRTKETQTYSTP